MPEYNNTFDMLNNNAFLSQEKEPENTQKALESKRAKALQKRPIDTNYILLLNKEIKEFKSELAIPF